LQSPDHAYARCALVAEAALGPARSRRASDAALYLAHVEAAAPLRRLADATGRPVSSVHRAVRRIEALRDDPLLDRVFDTLADDVREALATEINDRQIIMKKQGSIDLSKGEGATALTRSMRRALERLAEPASFLMVANRAERAGVFSASNRYRRPVTLLPVAEAAGLAARDYLRLQSQTECSAKYVISATGRAWLKRIRAAESGDSRAPFLVREFEEGARVAMNDEGDPRAIRISITESPLGWLARRRGADGAPFLAPEEVEAGERLRADFEAAQIGPQITQDWRSFLIPSAHRVGSREPAEGPRGARDRVGRALGALGPGLADVALRACCYQEGLETTERQMGWSARSGKVVLKIALQRLADHYGLTPPPGA
jgi:hypothetical protein